MKKGLFLGIVSILALLITVTSALGAGTLPIRITEAKINSDFVEPDFNSTIVLKAGDYATLKVDFWTTKYLDDVRIEAFVAGYSSTPVERRTATLTLDAMEESEIYTRRLSVFIPEDISPGDYSIMLSFSDDESTYVREYDVEVERPDHGISVRDISISPEGTIKGGRTIAVRTEVYNFGKTSETVNLGVTIENLDLEKQVTQMSVPKYTAKYSDSLYFTLPTCTPSGRYALRGSVEYANGLRRDVFMHSFDVSDNPECDLISSGGFYDDEEQVIIGPIWERTVVTVPAPQDAPRGGEEATYNIKISNEGKYAKSYYLEIEGIDWAWSSISPSNLVVVEPGDSITISLGLRAKDSASAGTHIFTINVMSGNKLLEQIELGANVITDGDSGDYGSGMGITANVIKRAPADRVDLKAIGEVGVTLLVTIIVIGVTVLYFARMEGDEETPARPPTTHYYDNVYSREPETVQ